MALGRPSVVTDVGDMARWVEHGRTGFVAAAPDLAGVARALEEAWAARPRWAAMGIEARRTFEARHPRDASAVFAARILAPDGALAGAAPE